MYVYYNELQIDICLQCMYINTKNLTVLCVMNKAGHLQIQGHYRIIKIG